MKKSKLIVFILFFVIKFTTSFAQIDTCFWFAAPWVTPDHTWRDAVKIHISGAPGTKVRLRQPAAIAPNKYDTTIFMPASSFFDYTFWRDAAASATNFGYDSLESRPANVVHPYGIYISATSNITVVYDVVTRAPTFYNPETYSMKGQNGLGTEFVCPFQTNWKNQTLGGDLNGDGIVSQPKQQIAIIATKNGTVVWITPKTDVVGHVANVTYSVAMNLGDVYTVENIYQLTSAAGQNLSGSIVVSNYPISVTISDDSVNTPGGGCFDQIGDQIVPVDVIGKEYIANMGFMFAASVESIFVVGTDNFTQITIDDGTVSTYTINKGDTKQYPITKPLTHILASKNVYLWQTTGYGCEAGAAILPPINCAGSPSVAFTRNNNQPFLLNILVRAGNQGNFLVNGTTTLVTAANFSVVPGTAGAWVGAQVPCTVSDIPVNSSNIIKNTTDVFALGIINGNTSTGGLFHYMSSFLRKVVVDAGPTFTLCAGSTNTISLNGSVTGGALTGVWTTTNGTGAIGTPTNLNTTYTLSANDTTKTSLTFFLTSTGNCTPVTDTFIVKISKTPAAFVVSSKTVTVCKNNVSPINLSGTVVNAIGGVWTGGSGSYGNPGALNTTYLPSPGDIATGSITIVLTPTGSACPGKRDTLRVKFKNAPTVAGSAPSFICTNSPSIALTGTVSGGASTGIWTTNGTGGFSPNDTLVTTNYLLSPSDYSLSSVSFTLTSTHNGLCNSVSTTFSVSIIQPATANAGANDTICATAGVIGISGMTSTGTGSWTTMGSGSFANANNLTTIYNMSPADTIAGTVTLLLYPTGALCLGAPDTVVYAILKAPLVNAGPDISACKNANVSLNGIITGFTNTGQWTSSGTGTFTPNANTLNATYLPSLSDISGAGIIKLVLQSTNNKGCSAQRDSVTITFKPAPFANFTFSVACATQPLQFTSLSTFTSGTIPNYNWNFGDGGIAISQNPIHSYSLANTYTVTHFITASNGCTDTIRKVVVVNSLPQAHFYFNNACVDHVTQFHDSSFVIPGSIVSWNWNFNDGGATSIIKDPLHTYTTAGVYNVNLVVTSAAGCSSSINKPVNVLPKPIANFGMTNNPTLAQQIVYFSDFSTPAGTIASWYWNFGDSISSSNQNPQHYYNNQGDFTVSLTITDQSGCTDTIRKPISVTLLPLVPTAFSPNKDGSNDFLFVKGGPFEKMYFRVYNSWGALLFETRDQKVGWDGTFKGEDQPMGVYVWVLDVDMYNNKSVRKTGDVTILR